MNAPDKAKEIRALITLVLGFFTALWGWLGWAVVLFIAAMAAAIRRTATITKPREAAFPGRKPATNAARIAMQRNTKPTIKTGTAL